MDVLTLSHQSPPTAPPSSTGEDLLAAVANGDRDAFTQLYDRLCPRVLGVVQRCLVDHAQSEEVAQEVFLEIWQSASQFTPERGTATGWVLTVAHRRAVDRVRSSQASRNRERRVFDLRDMVDDRIWEKAEVRLDHRRTEQALSHLTHRQREAVTRVYIDGYSPREVAAMLDISLATAKSRIRDGLLRLRDELSDSSAITSRG
ncbi:MAG: sigK [Glaciihabitans sp.]|nr:sigK [Glaciihabitans sp.]